MTKEELNNRYFEWMCRLVSDNRYSKRTSFRKLLRYLHRQTFTWSIAMDQNRAEDGMDLRYRFGSKFGYSDPLVAVYLDDRPCSILEMMIALSIRIEEHIMEDDDIGDRTGQWFWNMIVSLGLGSEIDTRFNERHVEDVITRFLERDYGQDGKGSLFTIEHPTRDMRNVEIWYQMCMYLNEII